MINSVFSFVLALGVLVFIHELGHYAVARWCGIRVIRFSVGFGKPFFKWTSQKTKVQWTLAWIPLGGYVRMLDERDPESLEGKDIDLNTAFNRKPVWQRIAVVLAGPFANLALASLLYAVLVYAQPLQLAPLAAAPQTDTVAHEVGLQLGDTITKINGDEIQNWNEVNWALIKASLFKNDLEISVERGGVPLHLITLPAKHLKAELGPHLASELGFFPFEKNVYVRSATPSSVGYKAGLKEGDQLFAVNQTRVESAGQFIQLIRANPDEALTVNVVRKGVPQSIQVTPERLKSENGETFGRIGVAVAGQPETVFRQSNVFQATLAGAGQMVEVSVFSLAALGKMLTGDLSWTHLSGPVSIASVAGQSSSLGILPFLGFLAMVSVSLGILNLLPIPVLDGGHLMYYFAEIIRGKPVDEVWVVFGQKLGILLIGLLTVVAFFNDIQRLF